MRRIFKRYPLFIWLLYAAICGAVAFTGYRAWSLQSAMNTIYQDTIGHSVGPADSEKVIVEFLDYRCSHCRAIHPTVEALRRRHPDLKVIYRHLPVFGKVSIREADIALAAALQGQFEPVHEALISRSQPITDPEIRDLAERTGLDYDKLREDMTSAQVGRILLDTLDAAEALGINATPSFVIGDIIHSPTAQGTPTIEVFEQYLAQEYGD